MAEISHAFHLTPLRRAWPVFWEALTMGFRALSLLLLTVCLLVSCVTVQPGTITDRGGWVIQRALLPHPQDASKQVEVLWTTPS